MMIKQQPEQRYINRTGILFKEHQHQTGKTVENILYFIKGMKQTLDIYLARHVDWPKQRPTVRIEDNKQQ